MADFNAKAEVLSRLLDVIPYPDQIAGLDTTSEPRAIRFTWRGSRFRVSTDFSVEQCEGGMLKGSNEALLIEALMGAKPITEPADGDSASAAVRQPADAERASAGVPVDSEGIPAGCEASPVLKPDSEPLTSGDMEEGKRYRLVYHVGDDGRVVASIISVMDEHQIAREFAQRMASASQGESRDASHAAASAMDDAEARAGSSANSDPFRPEKALGHTDMMVTPDSLDEWLKENQMGLEQPGSPWPGGLSKADHDKMLDEALPKDADPFRADKPPGVAPKVHQSGAKVFGR